MEDIRRIRENFDSFKVVCKQAGLDQTLVDEAQKDVEGGPNKVSRLITLYKALTQQAPAVYGIWRSSTASQPGGAASPLPASFSMGQLRPQPSISSEFSVASSGPALDGMCDTESRSGVTTMSMYDADDLAGSRSPRGALAQPPSSMASPRGRSKASTSPATSSRTMEQSTEIQELLDDLPQIGGADWDNWDSSKLMRQIERLITDATAELWGGPAPSSTLASSASSSANGDAAESDLLVVGADEELASFPAVWKEAEHVGLVPKAKVVEIQHQLLRARERVRKLESCSKKATSAVQVLRPVLARLVTQVSHTGSKLARARRDAAEDEKRAQANFHCMLKATEDSLRGEIRMKEEVIGELQSSMAELRASNEAYRARLQAEESRVREGESLRLRGEASSEELRRQLSEAQTAAERYRADLTDVVARLRGLEAEREEREKTDKGDLQAVVELTQQVVKLKQEKEVLRAGMEVRDARNRKLEEALAALRTQVTSDDAPTPERRRSLLARAEGHESASRMLLDLRASLDKVREEATRKVAALSADMELLRGAAGHMAEELAEARARYHKECKLRRRYFNEVIELKGSIRVFCRVRPLMGDEAGAVAGQATVAFPADNEIEMVQLGPGSAPNGIKRFEFDRVFPPASPQTTVFEDTQPLVASAMDGYNVCIFAYGQTGSGKTYTMEGPPGDRGVNLRALEELFALKRARQGEWSYHFRVSMLEIYNESIYDLLLPASAAAQAPKLEIRQGPAGNYVQDLTEVEVKSLREVEEVMRAGAENRTVHATAMNEHSSRSHCVLQVQVESTNLTTGLRALSKLNLIDLAGSERVSRSEATGDRLKEAQNINKSLSALGDVIAALYQKSAHVPYRNSKLTYLLQDSLGGESKTLMFVQVSPSVASLQESLCSLNFAQRAKCVELGQGKKIDPVEFNRAKQVAVKAKEDARAMQERLREAEAKAAALQKDLDARNGSLLDSSTSLRSARAEAAEQAAALAAARKEKAELQRLLAEERARGKARDAALARLEQQQQQQQHRHAPAAAGAAAGPAASHAPSASAAAPAAASLAAAGPEELHVEAPNMDSWEVPSLLGGGIVENECEEGDEAAEGSSSRPASRAGSVPGTPSAPRATAAALASPSVTKRGSGTPLGSRRPPPGSAPRGLGLATPTRLSDKRPSSSSDLRPGRTSRSGSAEPLDLSRTLDDAASEPGSRSSSATRAAARKAGAPLGSSHGRGAELALAHARKQVTHTPLLYSSFFFFLVRLTLARSAQVTFDHPDSPEVEGIRMRKSKVSALVGHEGAGARPGALGAAAGRTPPPLRRPISGSLSSSLQGPLTPRSRSATNLLAGVSLSSSLTLPSGTAAAALAAGPGPSLASSASASSLAGATSSLRPGSAHPAAPSSLTQLPPRRAVTPTGTSSSSALSGPASRVASKERGAVVKARPAAGWRM
eukprot:tig00000113_g5581.t1